jgi:hypothetical protein
MGSGRPVLALASTTHGAFGFFGVKVVESNLAAFRLFASVTTLMYVPVDVDVDPVGTELLSCDLVDVLFDVSSNVE